MSILIRKIERKDNTQVKNLIQSVMTEFKAIGEGYSIVDPELDNMFESYQTNKSAFYVICKEDTVLGCGGISPLKGGDDSTCELKKMYFTSKLRGQGFGSKLLKQCLNTAKLFEYERCYLETLQSMIVANKLYRSHGFVSAKEPLGNTGHYMCNCWYTLTL